MKKWITVDPSAFVELELDEDKSRECTFSGNNESAILEYLQDDDIRVQMDRYSDNTLVKSLMESGIEDADKMDRMELEMYVLWVATWNLFDGDE